MINKYSILNGEECFSSNRLRNDLVFISTTHIDSIGNNTDYIESWAFIGMSSESIKSHILQTLILLQR